LSELSLAGADPVKSVWHSLHSNIPWDRNCRPGRASQVLCDWQRTVNILPIKLKKVWLFSLWHV